MKDRIIQIKKYQLKNGISGVSRTKAYIKACQGQERQTNRISRITWHDNREVLSTPPLLSNIL